jgi:hypothetical protein
MILVRRLLLRRAIGRDHPAAVVDVNVLRNRLIIAERQRLFAANGEQIVIADPVWNELIANASWPTTLRASFELLSNAPEAVVASWSVIAMVSGEEATGEPAHYVVHEPMTGFLRQLVVEIAHGEPGSMNRLRAAIRQHGVTDNRSMALRRKDLTERLVAQIREDVAADRLRSVNQAMQTGDRSALLELVAHAFRPELVEAALVRRGVAAVAAHDLTSQPSATTMESLLLTHMAVEWAATHGVETAKPGRIHNDYVDTEYAVIAWACGGDYITQDHRARRRFEEGLQLCKTIWP